MSIFKIVDPAPCTSCVLCTQTSRKNICDACHALIKQENRCLSCGIAHKNVCCPRCIGKQRAIDAVYVGVDYMPPFDALIQAFKYNHDLAAGDALSSLLLQVIPENINIDFLMPIPLHQTRLISRGFNQAEKIAEYLEKKGGWKLLNNVLVRIKNTSTQTELSERARFRNVRHAFLSTTTLSNLHIGIIDDVFTTGATLLSAAKTLKQAGATQVTALVLARTQERN